MFWKWNISVIDVFEKGLKSDIHNLQQCSSWVHILLLVKKSRTFTLWCCLKKWDAWHGILVLGIFFFSSTFIKALFFPHSWCKGYFTNHKGFFFPSVYASVSLPCASHVRMSHRHSSSLNQCAISNSIFFFLFFLSLPFPGPSPKQCSFLFGAKKAMWHIWKRRYFSAGRLWEAQVWSCLDDWLIQGVSSLVSRWRELFTLFQNVAHGSRFTPQICPLGQECKAYSYSTSGSASCRQKSQNLN